MKKTNSISTKKKGFLNILIFRSNGRPLLDTVNLFKRLHSQPIIGALIQL